MRTFSKPFQCCHELLNNPKKPSLHLHYFRHHIEQNAKLQSIALNLKCPGYERELQQNIWPFQLPLQSNLSIHSEYICSNSVVLIFAESDAEVMVMYR